MPRLLTDAQIHEIRQLIADHHSAFVVNTLGPHTVPPEVLDKLKSMGLVAPGTPSTEDAYLYGMALSMADDPSLANMSYEEFKTWAAKNPIPLTPVERRAMEVAAHEAAQWAVGLGNRVGNSVFGETILPADTKYRDAIRGKVMTEAELAVQRREDKKALASNLKWVSKDFTRDWDRIAATELHHAHQKGVADGYAKKYGPDARVAKRPAPDACKWCKKLHLGPDGQPRIFKLSTLRDNGTNVGRKAADWRATISGTHPFCICQMVRVPNGWGFDENGEMVPGGEFGTEYESPEDVVRAMVAEDELRKAVATLDKISFQGIPITIENRAGTTRQWEDGDGNKGETKVFFAYGEIRRTTGADDEAIDCYIGPDPFAPQAFVVHQLDPTTGRYDEDKVFLGFSSAANARAAFLIHRNDGDAAFGGISPMTIDHLKRWVSGSTSMAGDGEPKGKRFTIPLEKAGCELSTFKAPAKRYGSLVYKNKRLFAKEEKTKAENETKKSWFYIVDPLCKAAHHKYLRRIPTGKTRPRWRYIYNITSKHHVADVKVGEKVKISSDESKGHFEVLAISADTVTIRHDSSGKELKVSRDKFHEMFRVEHKEDIAVAHARLKKTYEASIKWGSDKQRLAAEQQLAEYERRMFLEKKKPSPAKIELRKEPKKTLSKAAFKKEMNRRRAEHLILSGNTFDIKDQIKAAGGVWDRQDRVWLMPDHKSLDEMRKAMPAKKPYGKPKPSTTLKATSAQINYAMDLVEKTKEAGTWSKSDSAQHGDAPTRSTLQDWSRAEVSALIDDLKGVGYHKSPVPAVHTGGPAPDAPTKEEKDKSKAPYSLHGGEGYGCRGWHKGQTIRTSERSQKEKGWPEYITIVEEGSQYFREDGLSFNVGDEQGHAYWANARSATPEEIAPVKAAIEAHERRQLLQKEVKEIAKSIRKVENLPPVTEKGIVLDGEYLFNTHNIYGGGDWFVITDMHVWYVLNNGMDGDDWSRNNVYTGGAGGIGWRVPRDGKIDKRLKELAQELGGEK